MAKTLTRLQELENSVQIQKAIDIVEDVIKICKENRAGVRAKQLELAVKRMENFIDGTEKAE